MMHPHLHFLFNFRVVFLIGAWSLLTACAGLPGSASAPKSNAADGAHTSAITDVDSTQTTSGVNKPTDAISFWLGEAGWAFEQDRLTTPEGDNALYYINRVLTKDPYNAKALAAQEKVMQRYYVLVHASLNKGKVAQARVFLSRAQKVMPNHGELGWVRKQIDSYGSAVDQNKSYPKQVIIKEPETARPAMRTQILLLPHKLLKDEDKQLKQWLIHVASRTQALNGTMLIVAPTDAQARWVYQTLNSSDPDQRIRANSKRSQPPRVEVSYVSRKDELELFAP